MTFLDYQEARAAARRHLPRGIFEYIERGTERETALQHNRLALDSVRIVPRVLRDMTQQDVSLSLFGRQHAAPFVIAPTAFAGLVRHRGDIALARAAQHAGIPFTVATEGVVTVEDVVAEAGGDVWFQLYMWEGKDNWKPLVGRAAMAGVDVLIMTVDTPIFPKRVFNVRNGFGLPMRFGPTNIADVLAHPRWALDVLVRSLMAGGLPRFAHHPLAAKASVTGRGVGLMPHQPGLSWQHVAELRDCWKGKLVLKGVLAPEDAVLAKQHGADGIVVSSHGMRNFDSWVAPIDQLPAIRSAVGKEFTVLADSGIQTGSDILKLLRAGADAVMLGRSMLYALASGAQPGVEHMLDILAEEFRAACAFSGWPGGNPQFDHSNDRR